MEKNELKWRYLEHENECIMHIQIISLTSLDIFINSDFSNQHFNEAAISKINGTDFEISSVLKQLLKKDYCYLLLWH